MQYPNDMDISRTLNENSNVGFSALADGERQLYVVSRQGDQITFVPWGLAMEIAKVVDCELQSIDHEAEFDRLVADLEKPPR